MLRSNLLLLPSQIRNDYDIGGGQLYSQELNKEQNLTVVLEVVTRCREGS